jgi:methionyl-tRNA formyltransferase
MINHVRIVFMGTPGFAVPTLRRLTSEPGWEVAAVVCQPDRPVGRGGKIQPPAVKQAALELGLAVRQPERMRGPEELAWLEAQRPEALAVVAFGQLLPAAVFDLPRWGAINAHASLLPAYRGAAPIQWAMARGETRTGVTTMRINAGLDTGDMLLQRELAIGSDETAPELSARLAELAAELMIETLDGLAAGTITPQPQPATGTLAPRLTRADAEVDWTRPAQEIYNRWRGFHPWPGLHTRFRGRQLSILGCRPLPGTAPAGPSGCLLERADALTVQCGQGQLALDQVQLEGRKPISGLAFARGAHLAPGQEALGDTKP